MNFQLIYVQKCCPVFIFKNKNLFNDKINKSEKSNMPHIFTLKGDNFF